VHQLTLCTVFSYLLAYLLTYLLTVFSVRYLAFGLLYFNKRIVEVTVIVFHSTFINTQDTANLRHITDFEQSQGGLGRHTNRLSDRQTDGRILAPLSGADNDNDKSSSENAVRERRKRRRWSASGRPVKTAMRCRR